MKRAIIFPGQGSQFIGMGKDLAENYASARAVFEQVDDALKQKLSAMMFSGSESDLNLTENTQPALMAVSMAIIQVLATEAGKPVETFAAFAAGHSLGEYSALAAIQSLDLSDTARLLKKRGQAMQQAVPVGLGGMVALLGADIEAAEEIAKKASTTTEIVEVANDNAAGQVVISGHLVALERAKIIAAEIGIKRAISLPVSAPFHSSLMQPAAEIMKQALAQTTIKEPTIPLLPNMTTNPEMNTDRIRDLLVAQMTGRVRWRETIIRLKELGVQEVIEIGAGKVLTGLTKRIEPELQTRSLQSPADIDAFISSL